MALLSDQNRFDVWANSMREGLPLNLPKDDLRAAVNAIDLWIDSNSASFNSALPLPARTALSQKEKVFLFMRVVSERFGVE